jgi:hypothetical protein
MFVTSSERSVLNTLKRELKTHYFLWIFFAAGGGIIVLFYRHIFNVLARNY